MLHKVGYLANNLTIIIHESEKIADYITWYFIYVLELVIRVDILKVSDVYWISELWIVD